MLFKSQVSAKVKGERLKIIEKKKKKKKKKKEESLGSSKQ